MGKKVSAAQAAILVGRHERIVRGWIRSGKLRAERRGKAYAIDLADLERLTGLRFTEEEEKRRAHVEGLDAMLQEHENTINELRQEVAALRARLEALERGPSLLPSKSAEAISRPSQRVLEPLPRAAGSQVTKADAIRILAARHGLKVNTGKGWPWPDAALASEHEAIRWALAYVRGRPPHLRPDGWRWRCDVPDCPCHMEA